MSIKVTIDGKEIMCEPNQTVLDVAKKNSIDIPTLCYIPIYDTNRSGACRVCLVEITGGGRPGLQSSCTLPASQGLCISTKSEAVYQARRTVVELLLTEHLQDCRNCPTSGNCNFAKLCRDYDINGVPVCSECPNQKDGCLLSRGVLCLGPITFANCNAYCTRRGYRCEGCHSTIINEDVLHFGLEAYRNAGFVAEQILEAATVFSSRDIQILKKVMTSIGMLKGKPKRRGHK